MEATPTRVVLTYRDYEALPADGRRYELHHGELFVTAAPGLPHQRVVGRLFVILRQHVEGKRLGEVFVSPVDCILSDTTVVQPDLVYLESARSTLATTRGIEGPPTLAIEIVSRSTAQIDRGAKLQLYARHEIPHYWIVDPEAQSIEAYVLAEGASDSPRASPAPIAARFLRFRACRSRSPRSGRRARARACRPRLTVARRPRSATQTWGRPSSCVRAVCLVRCPGGRRRAAPRAPTSPLRSGGGVNEMKRPPIVIVGASLAGATAAVTLRDEGFDGDIVLIGAEARLPYNRPPLSKGYLRGQDRFEDQLVKPASYYTEQRIRLELGARVTAIDPGDKLVELEGGRRVAYDRLLVATGGRNRTLSVPGADLAGVFQLRTVEDCDRIRAAVARGRRAAVMGFSFIGSEVSASLRQLGVAVVAIDSARVPLARILGDEVGQVLADIHREKGVDRIAEDSVAALEGSGRVARVRTKKGRVVDCDLVVAGIGIVPNTELLAAAGAKVDNGVLVDERCRTSLPDMFAAGDVTNHLHPIFGRLRVEHWNNGYQQGRAAARSMLGRDAPYDYVHTFWSDQYEHVIEYVGFAASWDRLVFRGRPESRKFLGFYLNDGVVRAVVGLDRGGDPEDPKGDSELKAAVDMIRRRVPVDPAKLADESSDLRALAGARA